MRCLLTQGLELSLVSLCAVSAAAFGFTPVQKPVVETTQPGIASISGRLFTELERLARLVDISYCIGSTGVSKPFDCVSRCKEFPTLSLATTWNTGFLLSDSCGYIAVDHGSEGLVPGNNGSPDQNDRRAIVIAFRGTYSIANTVVDLSTVPQEYVPYPSPDHGGDQPEKPGHKCENCTVHQGFHESWKQARKLVLPEVKQLKAKYPDYPIYLVGHSLGGAVACLAALELKVSMGYDDVIVTTFGEPRTGNYKLARYVDDVFSLDNDIDPETRSYRRVTHKDDPVPLLPLDEWGYRSHAGEIYISKHDLSPSEREIHICTGDTDPTCSAEENKSLGEALWQLAPWKTTKELSAREEEEAGTESFPTRFKLWQLFFAHRDYFWRLGLCVPGGDPADWGRKKYDLVSPEEL